MDIKTFKVELKGDKVIQQIPSLKDKALRINLNENIYGTFAEIGAGQETVRHFFRAGASSGTIAKAMSAYDKDFSDSIYGIEADGRYVSEIRLRKMLTHETTLIEERLSREKHPDKLFFSYANTVATIDFSKRYKGHGWVGIKYQLDPKEDYNQIILHIRFKENDAKLQQETLGILGVNLIYGAFYKLTMVMTMFVQAFKFAAEPFFFKQQDTKENRVVYADVMYWFIGVCSFIFLACMLFVNQLAHLFIKKQVFFDDERGLYVVPILLLANLFLGIYYNLSVWYKLSNNTKFGALIAIVAALLTIGLNIFLIPVYGFVACAYITLVIYGLMCVAAYWMGSYYFPIPYQPIKYIILIMVSLVFWYLSVELNSHFKVISLTILTKCILLALLLLIIWLLQPKRKKNKFATQ